MMSTLLACRVLSLEVDLHIANEMHRDLEAALRMNFIRIDAVCNQLVGEVQHQRVLAGKDLELYVKYGQTRRFQIDSQMKISTLLSHIAAEFELDRDPEEEEKYDTQFEAEAHIKIQVNGKSWYRNDLRNEHFTLRDVGIRNEQTISVIYNPGAAGGARKSKRSDKREMDASDSEEADELKTEEQESVAETAQEVIGGRKRKLSCSVQSVSATEPPPKKPHWRTRRRKPGPKPLPVNCAKDNRQRRRQNQRKARHHAQYGQDYNADVWREKMFPDPKPNKRYTCRMPGGLSAFNENGKRFKEHHIGLPDRECPHCGALLFKHEVGTGKDKWNFCCKQGKIRLPLPPEPPAAVKAYLTGTDPVARFFQQNIYILNSALSLSSSRLKQKDRINRRGIPKFILSGRVFHTVPELNPSAHNGTAQHARNHIPQIYTWDPEQEINARLGLSFLKEIRNKPQTMEIIKSLQAAMHEHNWIVRIYQSVFDQYIKGNQHIPELTLRIQRHSDGDKPERHNGKTYDNPSNRPKIATVVPVCSTIPVKDIKMAHNEFIATNRKGITRTFSTRSSLSDPFCFPIFYPRGTPSYAFDMKLTTGKQLSLRRFYRYHLFERKKRWNPFIHGKRLFEAWISNAWAKCQDNDLNFIRGNQKLLRRETYQCIKNARAKGKHLSDVGTEMNILPSSFTESPRYLMGKYQDALAMLRQFKSKPDLFITFTANEKWAEITEAIAQHPNLTNSHRDDIIARVFNARLKKLLNDLTVNHVLGETVGRVWVVEFQKRGLPHAHILLMLHPKCKLTSPEQYDQIVSARIPDPKKHPRLHQIVQDRMIHGPCQFYKACLRDGECSKYFPKPFQAQTQQSKDGYPLYCRVSPHEGGFTCQTKQKWSSDFAVSDTYVVPYNPGLLLKYNAHINVEICCSIESIKYLYKYIYKGHDHAHVTTHSEHDVRECDDFVDCRFHGAAESCYRVLGYSINSQAPATQALIVHLPEQQAIYYKGDEAEHVDMEEFEERKTQLMQYFANNAQETQHPLKRDERGYFADGTLRPLGTNLLYHEYPQFYRWSSGRWIRRPPAAQYFTPIISRMHYVNFKQQERYYLRLLLLHRKGCTSFEELRTVHPEKGPCATFRAACADLGLLDDDKEWERTLEEACSIITSAKGLRQLFAMILNHNTVIDPAALWQTYKHHFASDIRCNYYQSRLDVPRSEWQWTQPMFNECLFAIEELLLQRGDKDGTLQAYGLPTPKRTQRISAAEHSKAVRQELEFDAEAEQHFAETAKDLMNNEQRKVFATVLHAIDDAKSQNKFFSLQAAAGTGKTFVCKALAATLRGREEIALCNATSGIAATLMPNGRTVHSRFGVPLHASESSMLTIKKQSATADLIRRTRLIIWDEAPMANKSVLHWINRQLQDIMGNRELFGGKVLLLCGDFQQLPAVVPRGTPQSVINSSIKRSPLFQYAVPLTLVRNERLRRQLRDGNLTTAQMAQLKWFNKWLSNIGSDNVPHFEDFHRQAVQIPSSLLSRHKNLSSLIDSMYGNVNNEGDNAAYFQERAILTPKNDAVREINDACLAKLDETHATCTYESTDSVGLDDTSALFTQEFLNSRDFNGIPRHRLTLKTNVPIMLLRNIDHANGLCNGTRLLVKRLHTNLIEAVLLSNPNKTVFIPRMITSPSGQHLGYEFKRRQFPVRVAYAMSINKAQGQTLHRTAVYMPQPVFQHGQLYVAVSRVTSPENLEILIEETKFQGVHDEKMLTKNIVYKCLLD